MMVPDDISLYVHIPFCRSRCDYCDFFTRTGVSEERQRFIVRRILEQASRVLTHNSSPPVRTVYIGGGTPSSLPPELLSELLFGLYRLPGIDNVKEWTIECNPEQITPEFIAFIGETPVDRLSIGIQSFDPEVLRILGRRVDARTGLRAMELIARTGKNRALRWSGDLITAVPGQTDEMVFADISRMISFDPAHLSVYELGIEHDTRLGLQSRRGRIQEVDDDRALAQLRIVRSVCEEHGLARYEVSNFARAGAESLHNLRYWEMRPYAGVGPGAVGTLPGDTTPATRISTGRNFQRYLTNPDFAEEREELSPKTLAAEFFLMGLRTGRGVDCGRFQSVFGIRPEALISGTIARNRSFFADPDGSGTTPAVIRLTDAGIDIADRIVGEIFDELDSHVFGTGAAYR